MANIMCVIGSGYGDEGKGLMTDFYAHKNPDAIVVRSNGGAQAGHTVTLHNQKKHIFSHFGSGTLVNNITYLSEYFVTNPLLFVKEYQLLQKNFNITPDVYVDADCMFTTPYDMLLNQLMETLRGDKLHGSCGVGFGETINRCTKFHDISIGDIVNLLEVDRFNDIMYEWLVDIRDTYLPTRIDIKQLPSDKVQLLHNPQMIYDFIDALRFMLDHVNIITINQLTEKMQLQDRPIIFEGAQGLQLDMDYGFFPHVTRSNCGMKNIGKIIKNIGGKHDVEVNYITRAYSTRHGAGPLPFEDNAIYSRHSIKDSTNIFNEWQQNIRFAPFNVDNFDSITNKDFANYAPDNAKKVTTMTCIDQLQNNTSVVVNNKITTFDVPSFIDQVSATFDYNSYGPTRSDVKAK